LKQQELEMKAKKQSEENRLKEAQRIQRD